MEMVCEQEATLLQLGKVEVLDKFEVTVQLSDGESEITVIADRTVYGMDVVKKELLKQFNLVSVRKTTGSLATYDLKVTQFKTPGDQQMDEPMKIGHPVHLEQRLIQGRFSPGGR